MARKRYSDEDVLKLLREIDVHLHGGLDVVSACRKAGISGLVLKKLKDTGLGMSQKLISKMLLGKVVDSDRALKAALASP
ncbi:hypothetical protein OAN58_03910 [Paracoccaceae bacterium]|nr:hypothetical protein [Paracoccaceae bacterium]